MSNVCEVQRFGIRGTNAHDYWACAKCRSRWGDGPPKVCLQEKAALKDARR